jgi:hypothetical protein
VDNCDPAPLVTHLGDEATGSCPKLITRTYQATDVSGNLVTHAQVITVNDTNPPTLQCPSDLTVQCLAEIPTPDPTEVVVMDNCGPLAAIHLADAYTTNGNVVKITRTYQATDVCGNRGTCAQMITVRGTIRLSILQQGANVVISWPVAPACHYILEVTPALGPPPVLWSPVTAPVMTVEGQNRVTLPIENGNRFFRLRAQAAPQ